MNNPIEYPPSAETTSNIARYRHPLWLWMAITTAAVILVFSTEVFATTYHVETYGVDGSGRDGTSAQPWKSLSYAATRATVLNDLIKVGSGTFEESSRIWLVPGVSIEGAGESQTVITSIPNPPEPLKSWLIGLGNWNNNSIVAGNQTISNLTLDGRNHTINIGVGSYGRNGLTVHDVTFTNFYGKAMVVQGANDPVWSASWPNSPPPDADYCANIQIYDCVFLNSGLNPVGAGWSYGALELNGVKNSTVKNCQFDETAYGGWGIKGIWFKNSNIHNCEIRVAATDPVRGKDFSIEIWYAENCQFFDNWANGAFSIGFNKNVHIHHNELVTLVGENSSYGVEFGGEYSTVDHNWFDGVVGVAMWSYPHNVSLSIHHNIFNRCDNAIFTRSISIGDFLDLRIYNNTLNDCGGLWGDGPIGLNAQDAIAPLSGTKIRNNIVANTTRVPKAAVTLGGKNQGLQYADQVTNTTITNNLFYNNLAGDVFQQPGVSGTVLSPNTTANPLFVGGAGVSSQDFRLQSGSPAIGSGVTLNTPDGLEIPFLGNQSDVGAYVQPFGQRIEAEMNHSVAVDVGANGTVGVGNQGLDSAKSLRLFDNGDTLRVHFKVPTAGYFDLGVRVRSGSWTVGSNSNHNPTGYFANSYSYKVDGIGVSLIGDTGSVSVPDSSGGGIYWGTMRSQGIYLPAGLHHVEIKMTGAWGFVDYIEIVGALANGSHQDIGAVSAAGNSSYDPVANQFTVTGSGADIWNAADEFHYVYQTLSGDGEIVARVAGLSNTNGWAKAGVMIRGSLAAGSSHAMMAVTPSNGAAFQVRTASGGTSVNANSQPGTAPYFVKLKRVGDLFTGYRSPDGITWTQVGATTAVTMGPSAYVGLAVSSHIDGVIATGIFDSVRVND